MSAVFHLLKLAMLDQLGAQLGLPPHADRAPAVVVMMALMLRMARQAIMDLNRSALAISDSPARSWRAGS